MRPTIGITLDWVEKSSFSPRSHYAIRDSYFNAVWAAGGLPIAIPFVLEAQESYLDMVDGLIIPGGDYPTPAEWYLQPRDHPPHPRPEVDVTFIHRALVRKTPFLGICAGMQTLAAATGGKLYYRVTDEHKGAQNHRSGNPCERDHSVKVSKNSLLHRITGSLKFDVNSHHNEAVATVGAQAAISAKAEDGVIEAVEIPDHPFALGVQWHPEFFLEPGCPDRRIFEALIEAASR